MYDLNLTTHQARGRAPRRLNARNIDMLKLGILLIAAGLMALGASGAAAQHYPTKPVRILTTVTGGSQDLTARFIAPKLADSLGQQVIVDNRGGVISMELVAKAAPDGYTVLLASGSLWTSQFLRANVAWDAVRDYSPITLAVTLPNIIAVHPSLPVKSVNELIALAKARPGELNYSRYESRAILGIFAPARTPESIINRLNQEIARILNSEDVKRRLFDSGAEVVASSPAELADAMKSDIATTGKLIKDVGIRAE